MRKKIVAGNFKMNMIDDINKVICDEKLKTEIIVCPPFVYLEKFSKILNNGKIKLGSQNAFYESKGAFTGEISFEFLKEFNVEYVIIGHSERRHVFLEDDALINKKLKKGIENGFKVILCVGELLDDRNNNKQKSIVSGQLEIALGGIEKFFENIIIAYEPVWAIGTGINATPADAEDMHAFIRGKVSEIAGREIAQNMCILYGGSVNEENSRDILKQDNIDGVLVGGASLKYEKFNAIIKNAENLI